MPHRSPRPAAARTRRPAAGNARRCAGFSLLEIVLVLAIIGILLSVVALNIGGFSERGRVRATEASMRTIKTALDTYQLEYASYPPTLQTLQSVSPPILPTEAPLQDAWDKPFHYKAGENAQGKPFTLISFGGAEEWDPAKGISVWTIGQ